MKSKFSTLLLITFITAFLSGCLKKGEDDPAISLRSRKARVVGKWKIKSGTYNSKTDQSYVGAGINLLNVIYKDHSRISTSTVIDALGSISTNTNETYLNYTLEFKKNGDFISKMLFDYDSFAMKGTWNFTSGIGKNKNKDQIVIHIISTEGGTSVNEYTGNRTDYTYHLKELRNSKIVLVSEYSGSDNSGYSFTSSSELAFIQ